MWARYHFIHTGDCQGLPCGDWLLGPVTASLLNSLLLHTMSSEAAWAHPSPLLIFTLCSVKLLSRFLHDKNSREFLYYRKKVAEIRKEAQKLQAAPQKGRWAKWVGSSGEACGQTTPHVELGFLSWSPPWHGAALTAQVCALPGSWGHAGTSAAPVAVAPRSGEI